MEGPFGEWPGYYTVSAKGPVDEQPVIREFADTFGDIQVKIGSTNDKVATIESGLKDGDEVVMNPRSAGSLLKLPNLPDATPVVTDEIKRNEPGESPVNVAGPGGKGAPGAGGPGGAKKSFADMTPADMVARYLEGDTDKDGKLSKDEIVETQLFAAQTVLVLVPVAAAAPTIVVPFEPQTWAWVVELNPSRPSTVGIAPATTGNGDALHARLSADGSQVVFNSKATDHHYVNMGRWTTVIGVLISIGTAYLVMQFASIMDYVQALFSFFIAPLFGTVLLGMLWKRATTSAGFLGLLAGTLTSTFMFFAMRADQKWVAIFALSPHAQGLAQAMYQALWSCTVCVLVTVIVSYATKPRPESELKGLVMGVTDLPKEGAVPLLQRPVFWGAAAMAAFLVLSLVTGAMGLQRLASRGRGSPAVSSKPGQPIRETLAVGSETFQEIMGRSPLVEESVISTGTTVIFALLAVTPKLFREVPYVRETVVLRRGRRSPQNLLSHREFSAIRH
jgi:hypothetical protein